MKTRKNAWVGRKFMLKNTLYEVVSVSGGMLILQSISSSGIPTKISLLLSTAEQELPMLGVQ